MESELKEVTNTTFISETPEIVTQPKTIQPKDLEPPSDVGEGEWKLDVMLSKPFRTVSSFWYTTDAIGTMKLISGQRIHPLMMRDILTDYIESFQTNILKSYTYARYNIKFTIQLNSTKFYSGRLIFGYVPLQEVPATPLDFTRLSMFPHIFIDAGNSSPVEFQIPWFSPFSYFNQTSDEVGQRSLGFPFLSVVSPLRSPTSSTAVCYTIYVRMSEVKLHIPVNPALTYITPRLTDEIKRLKGDARSGDLDVELFREIARPDKFGFTYVTQPFEQSRNTGHMTNVVGNVMKTVRAIPETINSITGTVTGLASGVAQLASIAGLFDRPRSKVESVHRVGFSQMSFGVGEDYLKLLSLSPDDCYLPDNRTHANNVEMEMDYLYLSRLDSILEIVQWSTTQPPGTILNTRALLPVGLRGPLGTPTWVAMVAERFLYWRGPLVFTFSIVATHFHTGRLVAVFTNGYTQAEDLTLDVALNWPNVTMDLHNTENREYSLQMDYNANIPWLYNCDPDPVSFRPLSWLGKMVLYVQNSLGAPESVASTIDIIISVRAGETFELDKPRLSLATENKVPSIQVGKTVKAYPLPVRQTPAPTVRRNPDERNDGHMANADCEPEWQLYVYDCVKHLGIIGNELDILESATAKFEKSVTEEKWRKVYGLVGNLKNQLTKLKSLIGVMQKNVDIIAEKASTISDDEEVDIEVLLKGLCSVARISEDLAMSSEIAEKLKSLCRQKKEPRNDGHMSEAEQQGAPSSTPIVRMQLENTDPDPHPNVGRKTKTADIRDVVRRYGPAYNVLFTPPTNEDSLQALVIPVTPNTGNNSALISYYSRMYAGWSGSMRYKFIFDSNNLDNQIISVTHLPNYYASEPKAIDTLDMDDPALINGGGYALEVQHIVDEKAVAVEVPYAQPYHFLTSYAMYGNSAPHLQTNGVLMISVLSRSNLYGEASGVFRPSNSVSMQAYVAAGDDFVFTFPVPFVLLQQDKAWHPIIG